MPAEFYIVVGATALVVIAFVWLRLASKKRSDDPRIGENRESGWNTW